MNKPKRKKHGGRGVAAQALSGLKISRSQAVTLVSMGLAVLFFILWITSVLAVPTQTKKAGDISDTKYTPLQGMTIIVDPGHGGEDSGMIGVSSRYEKEVNLEISRKLRNLLEQRGAYVIMTRQTDDWLGASKEEDFQNREKIIAEAKADMFLCIHCNSFDDQKASGPQVFYVAEGSAGKPLATMIQAAMNEALTPVEPRSAQAAAYRLLKTGSQPSCTIECGFMSNPQEEALLQRSEYQQRVAEAIVAGVIKYMDEVGKTATN